MTDELTDRAPTTIEPAHPQVQVFMAAEDIEALRFAREFHRAYSTGRWFFSRLMSFFIVLGAIAGGFASILSLLHTAWNK